MRHPFHKEHPLTLLAAASDSDSSDESPNFEELSYCHACSNECHGFIFHCSECKFELDVNCATLMPTTNTNNNYYHQASDQQQQQFTHPHPLIPCYRKDKEVDFLCCVCNLPIKATIYVCLDCKAFYNESCAQLPQQITHQFHPHHSLTLTDDLNDDYFTRCNACGVIEQRFYYCCSECDFDLDVKCASLVPKAIENHRQEVVQVPYFTHPHVLIPCDTNNISFTCSACKLSSEDGTVYVCLECRLLLHKSCAELPLKIKHPFHPSLPLVLDYSDRNSYYQCQACKCSVLGFKYWSCSHPYFVMDVTCASQSYTFKAEHHHHPIAFFNENKCNKASSQITCDNCNSIWKGFPFFRCVPCNFSIRLCCLSILPYTFKHSNHRHSLTLTYSPIKDHSDDDSDSEYCCDLCEETRVLHQPTYYCKDCHYVAHTGCVSHEILPLLEREGTLAPVGEIVMLEAKVDALITQLETLTTKLEELNGSDAQHIGNYQIGVTEAETRNASTYQKTFLNSTSDHPAIVEEEIVMLQAEESRQYAGVLPTLQSWVCPWVPHRKILPKYCRVSLQAEVDAVTQKLKTLTTKLDEFKERHPQHFGGYQIGSISLLGTKSSVTILEDSDKVVEEDCNAETTKKDEEEDEESNGTMKMDKEDDGESNGTMKMDEDEDELDEEREAITAKLHELTAKLEALNKKRARPVSWLNLK